MLSFSCVQRRNDAHDGQDRNSVVSRAVITCPDCGTRYRAETGGFGKRGRDVRCARCRKVWTAQGGEVDTLVQDADALALQDNQEDAPLDAALSPAVEAVPDRPDVPLMRPTADVGADVMMRDRADRLRLERRRKTIRIIWAVPFVLIALAALIAWFNRQAIVNRIPQMAAVYRLTGAEVRAGGLDMVMPEARTVLVDGAPVIRVDGTVRNLTRRALEVPLIELSLHDVDGQELLQWYVEAQPARLEGRGRLPIMTELTAPPDGAVSLRYRFVRDG